jgi:hypothetical protein
MASKRSLDEDEHQTSPKKTIINFFEPKEKGTIEAIINSLDETCASKIRELLSAGSIAVFLENASIVLTTFKTLASSSDIKDLVIIIFKKLNGFCNKKLTAEIYSVVNGLFESKDLGHFILDIVEFYYHFCSVDNLSASLETLNFHQQFKTLLKTILHCNNSDVVYGSYNYKHFYSIINVLDGLSIGTVELIDRLLELLLEIIMIDSKKYISELNEFLLQFGSYANETIANVILSEKGLFNVLLPNQEEELAELTKTILYSSNNYSFIICLVKRMCKNLSAKVSTNCPIVWEVGCSQFPVAELHLIKSLVLTMIHKQDFSYMDQILTQTNLIDKIIDFLYKSCLQDISFCFSKNYELVESIIINIFYYTTTFKDEIIIKLFSKNTCFEQETKDINSNFLVNSFRDFFSQNQQRLEKIVFNNAEDYPVTYCLCLAYVNLYYHLINNDKYQDNFNHILENIDSKIIQTMNKHLFIIMNQMISTNTELMVIYNYCFGEAILNSQATNSTNSCVQDYKNILADLRNDNLNRATRRLSDLQIRSTRQETFDDENSQDLSILNNTYFKEVDPVYSVMANNHNIFFKQYLKFLIKVSFRLSKVIMKYFSRVAFTITSFTTNEEISVLLKLSINYPGILHQAK